jgi:hypothetical protein
MKILSRLFIYLEIIFWRIAIPLMSEASGLKRFLEKAFPFIQTVEWIRFAAQAVIMAGAGITLGFVAGYLRAPR